MSVQCGDEQGSINEDRAQGGEGVWSRGQGGVWSRSGGLPEMPTVPQRSLPGQLTCPAPAILPKNHSHLLFSAIASVLLTQDSRGNSPE